MSERPGDDHWLVRPETIRRAWRLFIAILALTLAAELVVHMHPAFDEIEFFGFNAVLGLTSCVGIILFTKVVGLFLTRDDTYYERDLEERT